MTDRQVLLIHGIDYKKMTLELMEASGLAEEYSDKSLRIGIKPNLVVAAPASSGATTHPELVEGVIEYWQKKGFANLCVLEGSWIGARTDEAYRVSGIGEVCRRCGVPYYDLQKDSGCTVEAAGMKLRICKRVQELDLLINMPVVKGHCQTRMTCALKNCKGLIPNDEKRRFHAMGLHRPIGHLAAAMPPMFCLVDNICGDLDFEEGGNPVEVNRIYACKDPVLCDAFACQSMGWDRADVPYIGIAEAAGIGSADVEHAEVILLNRPQTAPPQHMSYRVRELAGYTRPEKACSACYGALIHALDRMEKNCSSYIGDIPPLCIGQGYRGQCGEVGIGNCCCKFSRYVKGCPPSSKDILAFLEML